MNIVTKTYFYRFIIATFKTKRVRSSSIFMKHIGSRQLNLVLVYQNRLHKIPRHLRYSNLKLKLKQINYQQVDLIIKLIKE